MCSICAKILRRNSLRFGVTSRAKQKIILRYLNLFNIAADLLNLRSAVSFINFLFWRLLLRGIYLKFAFKFTALNGGNLAKSAIFKRKF